MTRLTYIHDTLYFDDKPINELNYTERGLLQDYVNDLPDTVDVITVEEAENIKNNAEQVKDLLEDFIDVLESLAY